MTASLVAIRCRTSDRSEAVGRGVDALAPLLGKRLGVEPRQIGSPGEPRPASWDDDLRDSRGCLLEAGGQVDDALFAGNVPVLVAGECSIALTTLSAALRNRPDARVLWLDAHGDFNTPETTSSAYLGGMCLAGACGDWDAGLAEPIPAQRVVLAGVRELDEPERERLERSEATVIGASLETLVFTKNALDRAPVYVHLDLDVMAARSDPPGGPLGAADEGGLDSDKLLDLLEAVSDECELVGLEITSLEAPEDELELQAVASTALDVVEPLLEAIPEGAHAAH